MTNGIGTGDYEYIVMELVYLVLGLITLGTLIKKISDEKRITCSLFEFSIFTIFFFILLRVGVIAFLLYLRLGFLPELIKSRSNNNLSNHNLERQAEVYLVTWELLSFLGTCALYASISTLVYKWRSLLNGDTKSNLALVLGMNSILFFIGIFCVIMQYFFEFKNYTWVHVVYYFCAINIFIMGAVLIYHADKMQTKVKPNNELSFQLFRHATYNKYSAVILGVAFITRGVVMALDNVGYKFLRDGSPAQVVWNIFFKYICWVIPELIIVMSVMYGRVHGNTNYAEVPPVEIADLEDVVKNGNVDISESELQEMRAKTFVGQAGSFEKEQGDGYSKFEDE
ncbi:hypothetical protein C9374_003041 [Naegleria lovaniensis]|uniref:Uncharacterized protein n=1 Tax=Naegleria lovaniensis TaxID=51637 RepID=A0AA88GRV5_NAELO|nr:uncharacterized protein C9374_003041 [Naegleria lovaniensis]KAG2385892.1 hypothetical protein C9374_003041 [Naegleria lovaniensis]